MQGYDEIFESHLEPVGSSSEGTKINVPDEFDVNVVLTKLSTMCEVFTTPSCPPGFVHLRKKEGQHSTDSERYFDNRGNLKCDVVHERFEYIFKQMLRKAKIWENETFFEIENYIYIA